MSTTQNRADEALSQKHEESVATASVTTSVSPKVDKKLVAQLVGQARQDGLGIDGENGLLAELTKLVVESALDGIRTQQGNAVEPLERFLLVPLRHSLRSGMPQILDQRIEVLTLRVGAGSLGPVVQGLRALHHTAQGAVDLGQFLRGHPVDQGSGNRAVAGVESEPRVIPYGQACL